MNSHLTRLTSEQRLGQIGSGHIVAMETYANPREMLGDINAVLDLLRNARQERDSYLADLRRIANARDTVQADVAAAVHRFSILLPRDLSEKK